MERKDKINWADVSDVESSREKSLRQNSHSNTPSVIKNNPKSKDNELVQTVSQLNT